MADSILWGATTQNTKDPKVKLVLLKLRLENLENLKIFVPIAQYHYAKGNCFSIMADTKEEELEEYNIDDEDGDEDDKEVQSIKREIKQYRTQAKQEFYKSLEFNDPVLNKDAHHGLFLIETREKEHDVLNARRHAIACMDKFSELREQYSRITVLIIEQGLFLSQPYGQRQFLYMARNDNDIAGCYDDNIYNVFTIQKYPQELSFPAGHPQPNSLYYAHPAIPGYYISIDTADEVLFKDKVNAFCQLVQCLGATEITFRLTKGKRIDESTMTSLDIEAGGEYKGFGGSAGYNNNRKKTEKSTHDEASLMRQTYNPTILPYIPNDNYWYKVDNDWHRLAKQRMEGNMLHYSTKISSHDTMAVTGAQMDEVKVAFNAFVVKGNASVTTQKETSFKREEETEWEISVEFKDFETPKSTQETSKLPCNKESIKPKLTNEDERHSIDINLDTLFDRIIDTATNTMSDEKVIDAVSKYKDLFFGKKSDKE